MGPACDDNSVLLEMVKEGLNVARMNFSHGTHEEHLERINRIKNISNKTRKSIGIMLDTKGPEIRTGDFLEGSIELIADQQIVVTSREVIGDQKTIKVNYPNIAKDLKIGDVLLFDDGLIGVTVEEVQNESDLLCRINNSGVLKNKKGVNIPNVKLNLPSLTEKDIGDILFGIEQGIDFIAASFIRRAEDVIGIRKILEENNAQSVQIISKIENRQGVDNIDEIIRVSDGIMVARGDLGVEIPAEEVPLAQKMMIHKCNEAGKPVITATQMLDSMMRNPRPTRAEVSDVATAIFDGTDAIMLSGETAAGKYPVESVKIMAGIAERIEASLNYDELFRSRYECADNTITNAISLATCRTALSLKASAVITATASGYTAVSVSKFRPEAPIIAATHTDSVMRRLSLSWGVFPVKTDKLDTTDSVIEHSVQRALSEKMIKTGDLVVVTAGVPVGVAGSTNLIKVHVVSELLYKKVGTGKKTVVGKARIGTYYDDLKDVFEEGDILVVPATDRDLVPLIEKAGAVVVEEGGLTSHAFIVCMNLGVEVVVGADNATKRIEQGEIITVNGSRGLVYKGEARIL